jgi:hypothetical protein
MLAVAMPVPQSAARARSWALHDVSTQAGRGPAGGPVLFGRDEVDGEDLEGDVAEGEGGEVALDGDAVPGRQWRG